MLMTMNADIDRVYDHRERFPKEFEMIELIYYQYRSATSSSCYIILQLVIFPEEERRKFVFSKLIIVFFSSLLLTVDHEHLDNKISTKLQMQYKFQLSMVIDKLKQSSSFNHQKQNYFTSIKIFM